MRLINRARSRARGIDPAPFVGHPDLRYCPRQNAILLRLRNLTDEHTTGLQRILLTQDQTARRHKRFTRGTVKSGRVVKLGGLAGADQLHVCEGPEDAMTLYQLGYRPVWCLLDKGNLTALPVLAGVEVLTIWADPDALGQAQVLAQRWMTAGRRVLVLEGKQSLGKSTLIQVLAPVEGIDYSCCGLPPIGSRDAPAHLVRIWLVELAELDALRRTELSTLKAFLSQTSDAFRAPYAKRKQTRLRQPLSIWTTNEDRYLSDSTGNRRFWPVHCTQVDLVHLRGVRDQLLAEAPVAYRAGATWWLEAQGDDDLAAEAVE